MSRIGGRAFLAQPVLDQPDDARHRHPPVASPAARRRSSSATAAIENRVSRRFRDTPEKAAGIVEPPEASALREQVGDMGEIVAIGDAVGVHILPDNGAQALRAHAFGQERDRIVSWNWAMLTRGLVRNSSAPFESAHPARSSSPEVAIMTGTRGRFASSSSINSRPDPFGQPEIDDENRRAVGAEVPRRRAQAVGAADAGA